MPWFKIDDAFHGHPKVLELSLPAVGLWTLAGSWCANYLTDGEITLRAIGRLGGTEKQAAELVAAGLWLVPAEDTFQFKDWADYQPLKAEVEAERDQARDRMKAVRAKKKGTSGERSGEQPPNNPGTFGGTSEEVPVAPSLPVPSRPSPPLEEVGPQADPTPISKPRKRGTRIPDDFAPTPEMLLWAAERAPHVNIPLSTEKFTNHWIAATKNATKLDWPATWRNWILRDAENAAPRNQFRTAAERKLEQGQILHAKFAAMEARNQEQTIFEIEAS